MAKNIDLEQLTPEQQTGLAYSYLKYKEQVETQIKQVEIQNLNIEVANKQRQVNTPETPALPIPAIKAFTEHVLSRLAQLADSDYQQVLRVKEEAFKAGFYSANPAVQAEVLTMVGVPDVVVEMPAD